ncbi:MAG: type II toxin-antitoxin system prevent-host-death family antitoxin [Anaerolineae bacterium]|nr:type II toxin-antitoxin system prevent-host-death family antitoxin [Anaerolineae bacterium]
MALGPIISKTDLARHTRQILDRARRGRPIIVESYGEEQVAIMDAADYRCLRAIAAYHALPPHPAPIRDRHLLPRGLEQEAVAQAIAAAGGDLQAGWDRVLSAYLDGEISLGRAAELMGFSRFDLTERFHRLGIPLRLGPATVEEAKAEVEALQS